MTTTESFINYICDRLKGLGIVRYKKMFGEYIVYVNNKPVITVCDDTAFVKKLDCIKELMKNAPVGYPYKGAKEHYILDMDDTKLSREVILELEKVTKVPVSRKKKEG